MTPVPGEIGTFSTGPLLFGKQMLQTIPQSVSSFSSHEYNISQFSSSCIAGLQAFPRHDI